MWIGLINFDVVLCLKGLGLPCLDADGSQVFFFEHDLATDISSLTFLSFLSHGSYIQQWDKAKANLMEPKNPKGTSCVNTLHNLMHWCPREREGE